MGGWKPKPKAVVLTCDWPLLEPDAGQDPLQVTVARLTFGQMAEIPRGAEVTYGEIHQAIAPYVLEWNIRATNLETGQDEPVPPPAEAGPEVFLAVDPLVAMWLHDRLQHFHVGNADLPKELRPSAGTPGPRPGKNGASPQEPGHSPRSRKAGTSSTGLTSAP